MGTDSEETVDAIETDAAEPAGAVGQDARNLTLLMWVGTIFFGFVPGLILYLVKKDDPYIFEQAKEALNWSITAILGYFIGWILTFVLIGIFIFFAVAICNLVFCIKGAIACSNGKSYKPPYAVRLVK